VSRAGGRAGAIMTSVDAPDAGDGRLPAVRLAEDHLGERPVVVVSCDPSAEGAAAIRSAVDGLYVELIECADGARALLEVGRRQADLVLVAATLPVLGAPALVRTLRQVDRIPVLLGVGEGDGDAAAEALAAGASRVLPLPYDPDQLRRAITTALGSAALRPGPLRRGALVVDPLSYAVTLNGRRIPMPARELEVLTYLARHSDRAVNTDELRDAVWGAEQLSERSKTVTVTVMRLRTRLGDDRDDPRIVVSVRGHGYRLVAPKSTSAAATATES
jgi:DNA-binding response OmpR family regulator